MKRVLAVKNVRTKRTAAHQQSATARGFSSPNIGLESPSDARRLAADILPDALMDPSPLPKGERTRSSPAPADSRAGHSELSLFEETGTNMLSELPELPVALSDISKPPPQDDGTDCLKPSSSNTSALKEDDFRLCGRFGSSLALLSHLPQDLISPRSEWFCESDIRGTRTCQSSGATPSVSEGLMESSVPELLTNHSSSAEHSQSAWLTWPPSPQSESLDTVIAPVSDLYIFESDTQDFILKPSVAPQQIKCPEYQSFSQTGEKEAGAPRKNASMCDSADVATPYRHDSAQERTVAGDESGMIQCTRLGAPAVDAWDVGLMLGTGARQAKAEVAGLRSDSPTEVWQDACQYLAGEDREDQDVLDKRGRPVMQGALSATGDLSFPPGKTQVSLYNPEVSDWIGWCGEKNRRPPVERWSSVDSWASALSDWAEIVTAAPEDITAAFTEIGAEIEALTQALAEVDSPTAAQAPPPEEPSIPESRPPPAQHKGTRSFQGVASLCEATQTGPEETHSSQAASSQRSAMRPADATEASSDRYGAKETPGPGCAASLGTSQFDGYLEALKADLSITDDADPVILSIIEDTDLEAQIQRSTEPVADGRCEVTHGPSVSQQETQRCRGPANVGQTELSPDLLLFTADSLTRSSVDLQLCPRTDVPADALPSRDGARQVEPQSGAPKFLTSSDPLSIGSSCICQATGDLEGDQRCPKRFLNDNRDFSWEHVQPCVLLPTLDGITDKASWEDDEELVHEKENPAEPSPERQCKHSVDNSLSFLTERNIVIEDIHKLSRELSRLAPVPADHFIISEEKRVAVITLEVNDPFFFWSPKTIAADLTFEVDQEAEAEEMPHKTHKNAESKMRCKKDKAGGHHHGPQAPKKPEAPHGSGQHSCNKQEAHPHAGERHTQDITPAGHEDREAKLVTEPDVAAEAAPSKPHAKKKKKGQAAAAVRSSPLADVESGVKAKSAKGRIEMFEAKLGAAAGKAAKDSDRADVTGTKPQQPEEEGQRPPDCREPAGGQPAGRSSSLKDDVVKRRRLSGDKFGKTVSVQEPKAPKADVSVRSQEDEAKLEAAATRKKAYSEVVKQKVPATEELKVVQPIQAAAVTSDPQSLCLWCQFACVFSDHAVTWSRDGTVLAETRRSAGDESRVSLTVTGASHKDLGKYQCRLSGLRGSVTLDYLLTYEVLSELVIPPSPKTVSAALVQVGREEEDVHCSSLMFKDDFLSDQYFGENHAVSIVTEKAHFGEGMHRRAFRTKLQAGQVPLLVPGHSCVLKVHNSISYGTRNNDELVQKNFTLAVEECQVQNTAREYIKAYTAVAQSTEAFGDVPEIIPIFLIHRPSNDIPYATLEEELIGDFVKYSVKDGKEINLLRRDSEAGQKCCAFQHWVYEKTEGNLLVTDMQGVGMRLTDVGIATCKKGYKGFKGNCSTSFIDQFKALHQCNRYCEILELKSLQPKAKKPASAAKPKAPAAAAPKKKTSGPTVRGKT